MSYKSGDIITVSERCYANMTSNIRIYRLEDAYDSSDQWRMDLYFTDADGFPTGSLGTAITDALSEQVHLVGTLLGHAIRRQSGDEILALTEQLRGLCKNANTANESGCRSQAAAIIQSLSVDQIVRLLRG